METKPLGTDQYQVPRAVQSDIDYVVPGIILKSPRTKTKDQTGLKRRAATPDAAGSKSIQNVYEARNTQGSSKGPPINPNCTHYITPDCITSLYQIPPATRAHENNSLGIFEQADSYAQIDLDSFFSTYAPWIPNGTHAIVDSIDGGQAPVPFDYAGGESDLDFQLAFPLLYPQAITLFETGMGEPNETRPNYTEEGIFNTFLDAIDGSYCTYCAYGECGDDPSIDPSYPDPTPEIGYNGTLMCGTYKKTNVVSMSYSIAESDYPDAYQQRQCNEWGSSQ